MRALVLATIFAAGCGALSAQQAIGSVASEDATVTGDLSVTKGRTVLVGRSSVTAKDHTAEVALERGGTVKVCATSEVHLVQSQGSGAPILLLALDCGALEVHASSKNDDSILTPDLRMAVMGNGPLDLRMRVTRNGDTCVENKGLSAPVLNITDPFSDAIYQVRPGQHVLFEHGSLKEVVDHESSPCGCPEPIGPAGMSVAEALLAPGTPAAQRAAVEHPFPAAVSQGLAAPAQVPQATVSETHVQVATSLGYAGDGSGSVAGAAVASPSAVPTATVPPATTPVPTPKTGFGHRMGHFFKRIFGGG